MVEIPWPQGGVLGGGELERLGVWYNATPAVFIRFYEPKALWLSPNVTEKLACESTRSAKT
jgi:hypothetical protein